MKILLYTDNHFCSTSSILTQRGDKYSLRLENQIKSLNWVNQIAVEKQCDRMIHLGDFFDKPFITAEEIEALKEIKWNNLPKEFIMGNHEMNVGYASIEALSNIGQVIKEPTNWSTDSVNFTYLPYIPETMRKSLKTYLWDDSKYEEYFPPKKRVIFSHNDIAGLNYGGYKSKVGFPIDEILEECDLFINGHLHNHKVENGRVVNLGNLTGQNFSEDANIYPHRIAILETADLSIEYVDNPHAIKFYKLDIQNIDQLKALQFDNAVISVKTPREILSDVKEVLEDRKALSYKITTKVETKKQQETIQLEKHNHIQEYKDFIKIKLENNELLEEELNRL